MNNIYLLSGIIPEKHLLGAYETYDQALVALDSYFYRSLDEKGVGKWMYQFDNYMIESMEVGQLADNNRKVWYHLFEADYGQGTYKQVDYS